MTTNRKEIQNANRAYDVTHNELLEHIALLQKNLEAHNRQQAMDQGNWGYSGDLTSIRNSLIEINSRFTK